MKLLLPIDEDRKTVCIVFARAPLFARIDTDTKTVDYLENPAADAPGGAGVQAAQFVADQKPDALLTVRLGENSAEVLNAAQLPIFKVTQKTVEEAVEAFQSGALQPLTEFHAGYHGIR